jgi:adenosine deaminase
MDELKLPGNKTFQISNKQKCIEMQITFKNISKLYKDNAFENLNQQIDLDDDKINQMVESYLKNPEYLIYKNKIIIAVLMNTDESSHNLYLVDGQHRINMGIKLYEEHNICDYLIEFYLFYRDLEAKVVLSKCVSLRLIKPLSIFKFLLARSQLLKICSWRNRFP